MIESGGSIQCEALSLIPNTKKRKRREQSEGTHMFPALTMGFPVLLRGNARPRPSPTLMSGVMSQSNLFSQ